MTDQAVRRRRIHLWIRRAFLAWATFAMLWLANSVRTQGVDDALLETSPGTIVTDSDQTLTFQPRVVRGPGLIFFPAPASPRLRMRHSCAPSRTPDIPW